ncbi:MAG: gamma-glutamyltransferase, partial [Bacteroidetes bacterium]
LMQLLKMVEPFPLGQYGRHSAEAVHLMTEAERRVYADRAAHLGDPDFYPVPRSGLLDSAYIRQRMSDFQPDKATPSDSVAAGKPMPESDQTTHFSIVDAWGNAVSVTTTLNGGYGSSVVVGGAGFLLNNEMDDFSIKPGVPNAYGLVSAKANAIEPAKRMLSSMTPTIVTRNDSLFMVVGTPGGATIITSVFQNIVNVIDFGYGMQESVSATRFHSQWLPDKIFMEEGAFDAAVSARLEAMGHVLLPREPIGRVDAILLLPDGRLEGGADPRGDDFAAGY